ncbi:pilus assembly PilX N-terminal domain-containing protein [uncultured Neptuniibacter sp.]|uniref:pilus assembly PilX N-terminal domain-containing protein n=1 Tax=uncultured Neptuniibacter sp. TaxID=502143 RepID=UPI0026166A3D|nr:pilus assembly PilX N-terminal domain-containing protein [uncultured Neptuniibacter sp.]
MSYKNRSLNMRTLGQNTKQFGAATLLVTVVLLAMITLVSIYITKIGLLESRTAANANRAKEALHNGQAGLDYGALMFLDQGTSWADGTIYPVPMANGASVAVRGVINSDIVTIQAIGESLDQTGSANVSEGYGRFPLVAFGELPPLMSNGNFPPSGTFSIVANPNGGGTGVPVSAWVNQGTTTGGASWQTCNMDEFLYEGNNSTETKITHSDGFIQCDDCRCQQADNTICEAGDVSDPSECVDVVEDTGIPDVFQNTFGHPGTDWVTFRDSYANQMSCAALNALGANAGSVFASGELPLIWVEGNCSLDSVGSYDSPVIIVVHGDLTINANQKVFGIVFAFSDTYTVSPVEDFELKINGSPTVYGVILVNSDVNLPNGSFTLVYSQNILEKLSNVAGNEFFGIGRRAGSWTDFN